MVDAVVQPRRVILESPFAGQFQFNKSYARRCMMDSISRGEAPMVSHLLYTQVLSDANATDRRTGIRAGLAWLPVAEAMVMYVDHGESIGMEAARFEAERLGIPVEVRRLDGVDDT